MALEFIEKGYIEVYCNGVLVSKHKQEREAIQALSVHADRTNTEITLYLMTKPNVEAKHTKKLTTVQEIGIISGIGSI